MKSNILYPLLCCCFLAMTFSASAQYIKGEGPTVTEEFSLEAINGIGLSIPAKLTITQGDRQKVVVKGQKNILDNIKRKVKGGHWEISFDKNTRKFDPVHIEITVENLQELSLAGSGSAVMTNTFHTSGAFQLSISGSGSADIQIEANSVECSISGSGNTSISGTTNSLELSITGSGSIHAYDLKAKNCQASTVGSGSAKVNVSESLEASMVGSGSVYYKGDPRLEVSAIGSGKVREAN